MSFIRRLLWSRETCAAGRRCCLRPPAFGGQADGHGQSEQRRAERRHSIRRSSTAAAAAARRQAPGSAWRLSAWRRAAARSGTAASPAAPAAAAAGAGCSARAAGAASARPARPGVRSRLSEALAERARLPRRALDPRAGIVAARAGRRIAVPAVGARLTRVRRCTDSDRRRTRRRRSAGSTDRWGSPERSPYRHRRRPGTPGPSDNFGRRRSRRIGGP